MINSEKSIDVVELFIATTDVQKMKTTLVEFYTEWVNSDSNTDRKICSFVSVQFKSMMGLMDDCLELQEERRESLCQN